MAVDFKTFQSVVPHVTRVLKPVLLRGRHGVGKSQVVYQFAGAAGLPVVERRASQMTEGDLLGMPSPELAEVNGVGCSQFRPFSWLIQACTEPVVLFLDEVDRATMEVRQGIFELTDSRKIAGWELHPETLIFAAVNGGEHGAQYQVGEMDPAELDRWTVFDVEPTTEDWLAWGKDNVDGLVWDFINTNRNHLEHQGEFEPNKVYPSRRSWDRLSECLTSADLLDADTVKDNAPTIFNLATAFVGFEAAVALQDFIKTYEAQVTVENIIDDGQIDRTKDFGINDHSALVEKMEAKEIFKEELTAEQIQNLADYFISLPSEVAMKLWTVAGAEGNDVQNCVKLHQSTASDGTLVTSFIVEVLAGSQS